MEKASDDAKPRQLDIFADSRDVMLRNDLAAAVERRDAAAGRRALDELAEGYPADHLLAPARALMATLAGHEQGVAALPLDADSLAAARQHLSAHIVPAAEAVLGRRTGHAWLAPLWRDLAERAAHLPWSGASPDLHAAPLWLAAGAWTQAAESAGGIESWRRIPAPLAWMIEARYRIEGLDAIWPLLAELAWLAPARLDGLLQVLADPLLQRLHRRFEDHFEAPADAGGSRNALAWFPAWVLTDTPALAPHLALAEPGQSGEPERGMRLMVMLLGLERQGRHHDLMAGRRALRDLCAPLYGAYMATR